MRPRHTVRSLLVSTIVPVETGPEFPSVYLSFCVENLQ